MLAQLTSTSCASLLLLLLRSTLSTVGDVRIWQQSACSTLQVPNNCSQNKSAMQCSAHTLCLACTAVLCFSRSSTTCLIALIDPFTYTCVARIFVVLALACSAFYDVYEHTCRRMMHSRLNECILTLCILSGALISDRPFRRPCEP
jgi:hypothetical protein